MRKFVVGENSLDLVLWPFVCGKETEEWQMPSSKSQRFELCQAVKVGLQQLLSRYDSDTRFFFNILFDSCNVEKNSAELLCVIHPLIYQ